MKYVQRYLQGDEIKKAEIYMKEAIKEALKSPCEKSNRGVVIVSKEGRIIGRGFNLPALGFDCQPELCMPVCNKYCTHAEEKAIADAQNKHRHFHGSRLYHVKVKLGKEVYSGQPSCTGCSLKILQAGIGEVVLRHEQGFSLYSTKDFHTLSLKNFGLEEVLRAEHKEQ